MENIKETSHHPQTLEYVQSVHRHALAAHIAFQTFVKVAIPPIISLKLTHHLEQVLANLVTLIVIIVIQPSITNVQNVYQHTFLNIT